MQNRENALKEWLEQIIGHSRFTLKLLAGDASFRRYFRVNYDGLSRVLMDAPPEKESIKPFIEIDRILANQQVLSPQIFAVNIDNGFMLLEDFGDQLLLNNLNPSSAAVYYEKAIETLFKIQKDPVSAASLPKFDREFMLGEMGLFNNWFLKQYLSLELSSAEQVLISDTLQVIADKVAQQPQVMIHRDYHSRNLMLIGDDLGVIDFQDAMYGPISYDLVSLLKDCYISWPRPEVLEWVGYFYKRSEQAQSLSLDAFVRAFDLCGLQRHLKVLGIFARLYLRDGKPAYLNDLPLTLSYVLECTEIYPEFQAFSNFLKDRIYLP